MPFRLRNAAQSFQRFINEVLQGLSFNYVYIDDILVASSSAEEHASHSRQIFQPFQQHGLQLNVDKCIFGVSSLDFLGHHVDQQGITPVLEKVQSILSFPVLKTLAQLLRFMGLLNYYRRFISHCAATRAPITNLLKSKAKPIELSPAAHPAFEAAKKAVVDATLLHYLSSYPHAQPILTTDASNSAVGAVLHQQVNNQLQPLAFFFQKLQPAQTRYSTFSRELLAIYLVIRHIRHLLEGRDFSVHTDHKPLTYALKAKPDRYSPKEVRHLDYLSQLTADIRYVRGSDNVVADALSRPDINTLTCDFGLAKLSDLQSGDKSIDDLRSTTTVQLRDTPLPASPATLTTDRESQFQSSLLCEFTKLLGCAHITTTAYHPASNGLVGRLHRQLRSALMSQTETASWSDNLPLALLGIRSSVQEDIQCTAAEIVYGTPLRLPGEFVQTSTTNTNIPSIFVQQLKQRMAQLRPSPTRPTSKRVFVHEDLKSAPFVFVQHDAVRKPFCSPYDCPYEVLRRIDKHYIIQRADKTDTVSIDGLKSAYLECIPLSVVPPTPYAPSSPDLPVSVSSTQPPHSTTPPTYSHSPSTPLRTSSRSSRHIHFPLKLKEFSV
ncbi:hypothetical protein SprV_0401715100 [Sparganum proliferum]